MNKENLTQKEKITIHYLKNMSNKDLKNLSRDNKRELIKIFSQWFISEEDINAYYFNSNSDYLNSRLEEIYLKEVLENG